MKNENLHYRFTIVLVLFILLLGLSACSKDESNTDVSYPDSTIAIAEATLCSQFRAEHDMECDLVLVLYLDTSTYERYIYNPECGQFYRVTADGIITWGGYTDEFREDPKGFDKRFAELTTLKIPADDLVDQVYLTTVVESDGHIMLIVGNQMFELY